VPGRSAEGLEQRFLRRGVNARPCVLDGEFHVTGVTIVALTVIVPARVNLSALVTRFSRMRFNSIGCPKRRSTLGQ